MRRLLTGVVIAMALTGAVVVPAGVAGTADRAKVLPTCTSTQLSVDVGAIIHTPGATVNTVPVRLPIAIRNSGTGCVIGGLPKIAPVGVTAKNAIVSGSRITSTKFFPLWLRPGGSVYTYLSWSTPVGSTSVIKHWRTTCAPSKAAGFLMWVVPGRSIVNRHVKVTLPVVCTTGVANLTTEPLTARAP